MPVERESSTWRAVKAHCLAEIEKARDGLETLQHSEERQRGRIQALRTILLLGDLAPEIVSSDRIY